MTSKDVLVITTDPLTASMPGPAIRAWHLATTLSDEHHVTLVSSVACDRDHPQMDVRYADETDVGRLALHSDVVLGPGSVVRRYPTIARSSVPLIVDLYDPYHLENLEPDGTSDLAGRARNIEHLNQVVTEDLGRGDFFLCASSRQRDFWLGSLVTAGRVNPYTYDADPRLEQLIAVVPFGLPSTPPTRSGPGIRERFSQISRTDHVVVWGGGVYNWFDPLSLVHAVDRARSAVPDIRLVFLGMRNPNPNIPEMAAAVATRELASRLHLTGSHVFFNEGWVPYEHRADFLLDAQLGVSTSLDHIETRFSFRTRVLEYLWAGLPMLLTSGDTLSDLVASAGAGRSVPPGDVSALTEALIDLLDSPPERAHVTDLARQFYWERVAAPLLEFCRQPGRAADLLSNPGARPPGSAPPSPPAVASATPPTRRGRLRSLIPGLPASAKYGPVGD